MGPKRRDLKAGRERRVGKTVTTKVFGTAGGKDMIALFCAHFSFFFLPVQPVDNCLGGPAPQI